MYMMRSTANALTSFENASAAIGKSTSNKLNGHLMP
jgi:hypothetical protein